jgi:hypothetical protein
MIDLRQHRRTNSRREHVSLRDGGGDRIHL